MSERSERPRTCQRPLATRSTARAANKPCFKNIQWGLVCDLANFPGLHTPNLKDPFFGDRIIEIPVRNRQLARTTRIRPDMLALLLAAEQGLLVARAPVSVRRTGKIGLIAPPMQPPNFNQDQQFELEKLRVQAELAKEKAESDTKLAKEKAEADAKVAKESIVPTAVAQITVGVSLGLVIIAGVVPTVVTLSQVLVQNNLELNSVKTENKKLLEENKKLEEKEPPSPPATHPHHCQHQHPPTHTPPPPATIFLSVRTPPAATPRLRPSARPPSPSLPPQHSCQVNPLPTRVFRPQAGECGPGQATR